jgi:hypothetical protein
MPITPYLRGQAFDPEILKVMAVAFEKVCSTLGAGKKSVLRAQVAQTVIALAQRGIRNADDLAAATLKEVRPAEC